MRPWFLAAITLFCAACGDDGGDAITCSASEQHGTYLMTSTVVSGNCGDIGTRLVVLTGELGEGCANDSAPVVSADQCKQETRTTCTRDGVEVKAIDVYKQVTDDGSVIEGTSTVSIGDRCYGTYDVRLERQ